VFDNRRTCLYAFLCLAACLGVAGCRSPEPMPPWVAEAGSIFDNEADRTFRTVGQAPDAPGAAEDGRRRLEEKLRPWARRVTREALKELAQAPALERFADDLAQAVSRRAVRNRKPVQSWSDPETSVTYALLEIDRRDALALIPTEAEKVLSGEDVPLLQERATEILSAVQNETDKRAQSLP
jgi:hypothetical protein